MVSVIFRLITGKKYHKMEMFDSTLVRSLYDNKYREVSDGKLISITGQKTRVYTIQFKDKSKVAIKIGNIKNEFDFWSNNKKPNDFEKAFDSNVIIPIETWFLDEDLYAIAIPIFDYPEPKGPFFPNDIEVFKSEMNKAFSYLERNRIVHNYPTFESIMFENGDLKKPKLFNYNRRNLSGKWLTTYVSMDFDAIARINASALDYIVQNINTLKKK